MWVNDSIMPVWDRLQRSRVRSRLILLFLSLGLCVFGWSLTSPPQALAASQGEAIVQEAKEWEGSPYCFFGGSESGPTLGTSDPENGLRCGVGGYDPSSTPGFDCTGLTLYAEYRVTKDVLVHDSYQAREAIARYHPQVIYNESELEPGDLVYFGGSLNDFVHAGIYVGGGSFVSAVTEYVGVTTKTMAWEQKGADPLKFVGAIRLWSGNTSSAPSNGARFTEQGSPQQYISWYGASLSVSVGDAQAYDGEDNTSIGTAPSGYLASHPASDLPNDTVIRIVGSPTQYLYSGGELDPIGAPATSSCLLLNHGQATPAIVPTMWSDTIPAGPGVPCYLTNDSRFTEDGSPQQYMSWYGASLPISVGDAEAYNREGDTSVETTVPGYVPGHPAGVLPDDTIVRIVGLPSQYLYTGSERDPIDDGATSACLLVNYGQPAPAVVPTMWSDTIPVGPGVSCSLRQGQRFVQEGSLQQYISWYGASLPVSYGDAQAYEGEVEPSSVVVMPPEYVAGHPTSSLPDNTVVRVVGLPSQYLFTGTELDPVGDPETSACLLAKYGQAAPAVVPTMWSDTIPTGPGVSCPPPNENEPVASSDAIVPSNGSQIPLAPGPTTGGAAASHGVLGTKTTKPPQNASALSRALAKCRKVRNRHARAKCEATAKRRYGRERRHTHHPAKSARGDSR